MRVAVYGVGAGAVDPAGTGDGASVEPCVFGGFLFADLLEAGVGDGVYFAPRRVPGVLNQMKRWKCCGAFVGP
jgi:hypothetical protein